MQGFNILKDYNKADHENRNQWIPEERGKSYQERVYIKGFGFCPVISVLGNGHVILLPNMKTLTLRIENIF